MANENEMTKLQQQQQQLIQPLSAAQQLRRLAVVQQHQHNRASSSSPSISIIHRCSIRIVALQLLVSMSLAAMTMAWTAPPFPSTTGIHNGLVKFASPVLSFHRQRRHLQRSTTRTTKTQQQKMVLDPSSAQEILWTTAVSNLLDIATATAADSTTPHHDIIADVVNAANMEGGGITTTATATTTAALWESLVSTMYTSTAKVSATLAPAHGHSQPLWGPQDPYLTSGKSIAPSAQALQEWLSSSSSSSSNSAATATAAGATGDIAAIGPELSSEVPAPPTPPPEQPEWLQSAIQKATKNGWPIKDVTNLHGQSLLPGFSETQGILPRHDTNMPAETLGTFSRSLEWSAQFLNVVDKLPSAALTYVLVDFFLLRPPGTRDRYQEEVMMTGRRGDVDDDDDEEDVVVVEDGRMDALVDTISATGIRLAVFSVIAIVTLGLFGGE